MTRHKRAAMERQGREDARILAEIMRSGPSDESPVRLVACAEELVRIVAERKEE